SGVAATGWAAIEPVVSLGARSARRSRRSRISAALVSLVARSDCARSTRSKRSVIFPNCALPLRLLASTLVRSAASSLRICSIVVGRFWISCGSVAAAAAPTGCGVDRAKLDAPSAPASAPNAAAKATVVASRANRLARADAVGVDAGAGAAVSSFGGSAPGRTFVSAPAGTGFGVSEAATPVTGSAVLASAADAESAAAGAPSGADCSSSVLRLAMEVPVLWFTNWKSSGLAFGYQAWLPNNLSPAAGSNAEIAVLHLRRGGERGGRSAPHHPAALDQVVPVGNA